MRGKNNKEEELGERSQEVLKEVKRQEGKGIKREGKLGRRG